MTFAIQIAAGCLIDQPRNRRKLRAVGHPLGEVLDGSCDDGQDVVEIVQDATGKLPDDCTPLRLVFFDVRLRSTRRGKRPA